MRVDDVLEHRGDDIDVGGVCEGVVAATEEGRGDRHEGGSEGGWSGLVVMLLIYKISKKKKRRERRGREQKKIIKMKEK